MRVYEMTALRTQIGSSFGIVLRQRRCLLLLVFGIAFSSSALLHRAEKQQRSYTLLFPGASSGYSGQSFSHLYAEQRRIPIAQVLPTEWSPEEREIYYLVKELLYGPGPGMIQAYPFVPSAARLDSLALQEHDLYLNFNAALFTGKSEHYFRGEVVLRLIEKVIHLNFPSLKGVYISVDSMNVEQARQHLLQGL